MVEKITFQIISLSGIQPQEEYRFSGMKSTSYVIRCCTHSLSLSLSLSLISLSLSSLISLSLSLSHTPHAHIFATPVRWQLGHLETAPHLLSLSKDVELVFNTVPTGNRTPVRRVAVHYTTAAPCQLHPNVINMDLLKMKYARLQVYIQNSNPHFEINIDR